MRAYVFFYSCMFILNQTYYVIDGIIAFVVIVVMQQNTQQKDNLFLNFIISYSQNTIKNVKVYDS